MDSSTETKRRAILAFIQALSGKKQHRIQRWSPHSPGSLSELTLSGKRYSFPGSEDVGNHSHSWRWLWARQSHGTVRDLYREDGAWHGLCVETLSELLFPSSTQPEQAFERYIWDHSRRSVGDKEPNDFSSGILNWLNSAEGQAIMLAAWEVSFVADGNINASSFEWARKDTGIDDESELLELRLELEVWAKSLRDKLLATDPSLDAWTQVLVDHLPGDEAKRADKSAQVAMWSWSRNVDAPGWTRNAAKQLWEHNVRPRHRMGGAGLVLAPSAIVRTFGLAATKAPERKGDLLVYEPFDHRAAIINMAAARGLARARVAQKPIFWRVIGYLLRTMEQQRVSGAPVHNLIWTPTYDALRKSIGSASAKDVAGVRETLEFLEALSISNVARREAMFLSINTGAKQDGVAGIGLEIGLALRVDELARRNIVLADDSPWKIPVLPFEMIPTLSSPRSIGVGINAAQGLPLHFHDRRAEIAELGEVHIPRDEWHRYFDQQQVPHGQREKLLELFTSKRSVQIGLFGRKSTGAPLLVTGDRSEHYRFGPDFAPEWDHLVDQSQLTEDSTARGKASAEKRVSGRREKIANKTKARAKAKR